MGQRNTGRFGLRASGLAAAIILFGLSACTINNDAQEIAVRTMPPGADCTLYRGGGILARISPTPGTVTLAKTAEPIRFACTAPGYQPTEYVNAPAAQESGAADRIATLVGQSSGNAAMLYASPIMIHLAPVPKPAAPPKPARIPFGALQPAPKPIPTPKVESAPLSGSR